MGSSHSTRAEFPFYRTGGVWRSSVHPLPMADSVVLANLLKADLMSGVLRRKMVMMMMMMKKKKKLPRELWCSVVVQGIWNPLGNYYKGRRS